MVRKLICVWEKIEIFFFGNLNKIMFDLISYRLLFNLGSLIVTWGTLKNIFPIWLTIFLTFLTGISGFFGSTSLVSITNHLLCLQVLETIKVQLDAWNAFVTKVKGIIFYLNYLVNKLYQKIVRDF
jgi:hypothetical protein